MTDFPYFQSFPILFDGGIVNKNDKKARHYNYSKAYAWKYVELVKVENVFETIGQGRENPLRNLEFLKAHIRSKNLKLSTCFTLRHFLSKPDVIIKLPWIHFAFQECVLCIKHHIAA